MTKFGSAALEWMQRAKKADVSTDELWKGLSETRPDLTAVAERRKTPRTTCMRDLRKDDHFEVGGRRVKLAAPRN